MFRFRRKIEKTCIPVVDYGKEQKPYPITVKIIKPVAIITITTRGIDLQVISRWELFKLLIKSMV